MRGAIGMGTDLKTIDAVNRQIDALTEIGRQIRECGDIGEIKKHKDTMEQLRLLAKRLGAGIPVLNAAWKETMKSRRSPPNNCLGRPWTFPVSGSILRDHSPM